MKAGVQRLDVILDVQYRSMPVGYLLMEFETNCITPDAIVLHE